MGPWLKREGRRRSRDKKTRNPGKDQGERERLVIKQEWKKAVRLAAKMSDRMSEERR